MQLLINFMEILIKKLALIYHNVLLNIYKHLISYCWYPIVPGLDGNRIKYRDYKNN